MNLKTFIHEALSFTKILIIFIIIGILLRVFVFATFEVSGESMANNFHNGDRLIVSKYAYKISTPKRFDVVIFHENQTEDYIKRVIGLPGEKIQYVNNKLYVNDKPIVQDFLDQETYDFTLKDLLGSETVPEGYVFVLGDNRTNSKDSRVPEVGFVPIEKIIGKVSVRFGPLNKFDIGVSGNQRLK